MPWQAFTEVSDKAIAALRKRIADGTLQPPLYEAALQSVQIPAAWKAIEPFADLPRDALVHLLDAIQRERAKQAPTSIELVWTGPETNTSTVRDTVMVMQDLLAGARHDVLIAGYTFDHGREILLPLHQAMQNHGIKATLIINVKNDPMMSEDDVVKKAVSQFFDRNWPTTGPRPALYHDPRTSSQKVYASMHAKAIVVDSRYCLIGSANFTRRGQQRNIEMGVLIDNQRLADQVLAHWHALIQNNFLSPAYLPHTQ